MIYLTSPTETWAHSWPAGLKLAGLCGATLALFFVENLWVQTTCFALILVTCLVPGRYFFYANMRVFKFLWPFVVIVGLWHIWTSEIATGYLILIRMLSCVFLANLVTMTTRLSDMIDVVKWLLSPLSYFGLNLRVVEISIALVIRLTPVLVEKGTHLGQAWRARSPKSPRTHIILPFAIMALDDADTIAEALRARGGFENPNKEDTWKKM